MPGLRIQTLDEQEAIVEREEALGAARDRLITDFEEVWAALPVMQEPNEALDNFIHQMQAERRLTKGFSCDSRLRER